MDALAPVRAVDRFQQRHPALAVPVAVVRKFADDQGPSLTGLIAYRAFFSLFPLLLLFTTILGYVLAADSELRREAVDSVLAQLPVIGEQIRVGTLEGSGVALAIGILGALWAGFRVIVATEQALDRVWAVPHHRRRGFIVTRLRGLVLLIALGALVFASTAASGLVGGGATVLGPIGGIALAVALNLLVFAAVFTVLGARQAPLRALLPGIALAAACWLGLQLVGGYYISNQVRGASPAYGTFALVLGLLVWLHLGAMLTVLSAELNVVRARRLWPRSLLGVERPEDERVMRDLAGAEARDEAQRIHVDFGVQPPRG